VIPKEMIPEGRRYLNNEWVFKSRRNGIFRARLVACGYSQVPGIDFTDSYAPVINDVSFRISLIGIMIWNIKTKIIDIETTFLHGDLEQSIFMEIPSGLEVGKGILKKIIYGIAQSPQQFHIKFFKVLKSCGFTGSLLDPCLWFKQSNPGIVMMSIYVKDCLTGIP
jgi:hypothetical protein